MNPNVPNTPMKFLNPNHTAVSQLFRPLYGKNKKLAVKEEFPLLTQKDTFDHYSKEICEWPRSINLEFNDEISDVLVNAIYPNEFRCYRDQAKQKRWRAFSELATNLNPAEALYLKMRIVSRYSTEEVLYEKSLKFADDEETRARLKRQEWKNLLTVKLLRLKARLLRDEACENLLTLNYNGVVQAENVPNDRICKLEILRFMGLARFIPPLPYFEKFFNLIQEPKLLPLFEAFHENACKSYLRIFMDTVTNFTKAEMILFKYLEKGGTVSEDFAEDYANCRYRLSLSLRVFDTYAPIRSPMTTVRKMMNRLDRIPQDLLFKIYKGLSAVRYLKLDPENNDPATQLDLGSLIPRHLEVLNEFYVQFGLYWPSSDVCMDLLFDIQRIKEIAYYLPLIVYVDALVRSMRG